MTLHRPYRAARGVAEALEELKRGSGTKYDSGIVQIAVDLVAENELNLVDAVDGGIANVKPFPAFDDALDDGTSTFSARNKRAALIGRLIASSAAV